MRKIWLIVFSLLLVLSQVNVSEAKTANATVSLTVPVYLEMGEIPDTVITVTDPTLEETLARVVTFSVKTNVRASLSVPSTTTLTRIGGVETLDVTNEVSPSIVEPPGKDVCLKWTCVDIKGLNTMAGTYEGEVTITMSPVP